MTLCLAWQQDDEVFFASDSRLTESNQRTITDEATKIFRIGVEIYGAIPSETPNVEEKLLHRTNFGFCFTGSYLNGSLLADTMEEVLSSIQCISDITIDNLSAIAFAIYKQVSTQLIQIHRENGLSEVLLGGYCPVSKEFKLYKFYSKSIIQGGLICFQKDTIEMNGTPIFIGDNLAKNEAKKLSKKIDRHYSYFHLLREIIKNKDIPTVGGNIQAGVFRLANFKTNGIVEYSTFKDDFGNLRVKDSYKFRGLSLDFDDNELRSGNINIKKMFFNPFQNERDNYFREIDERLECKIENLINSPKA